MRRGRRAPRAAPRAPAGWVSAPRARCSPGRRWSRPTALPGRGRAPRGLGRLRGSEPGPSPQAASRCSPVSPPSRRPRAGISQISAASFQGTVTFTLCLHWTFEIESFPGLAEALLQQLSGTGLLGGLLCTPGALLTKSITNVC